MNALVRQRCLHHAGREAVARCPECKRFYCRECVSEHEDRVLCTDCLRKLSTPTAPRRRGFGGALAIFQCVLAVAVAWFFFFLIGRTLLAIPTSFHEGTLWRKTLEGETR